MYVVHWCMRFSAKFRIIPFNTMCTTEMQDAMVIWFWWKLWTVCRWSWFRWWGLCHSSIKLDTNWYLVTYFLQLIHAVLLWLYKLPNIWKFRFLLTSSLRISKEKLARSEHNFFSKVLWFTCSVVFIVLSICYCYLKSPRKKRVWKHRQNEKALIANMYVQVQINAHI